MEFVEFSIPKFGTFTVTGEWAAVIAGIASRASEDTTLLYPDAEISVPVWLVHNGPRRIAVIKEIRTLTGQSLKDAKYASDKVQMGHKLLLGRFPWPKARDVADKFREAGATVSLPSPLEMLARQAE